MSHDKIYFFFIVVFLCNKKKCLAIAIKFNMYQIIEVCVIPFSERKGYILDKYTLGKTASAGPIEIHFSISLKLDQR